MAIEVEKRAVFDEAKYVALAGEIMALGAEDLGANDTDSIFYVADDAQVKLQVRRSKGTAKIAWKSGGLDGASSRTEIEVGIDFSDTEAAESLIDRLLPGARKLPSLQQRHDYELDSVNIALKYSDHWGYHLELDEVVESQEEVGTALERIQEVADKLQVHLFTAEEENAYTTSILKKL